MIKRAIEITCLPREEAILAMIYLDWNNNKLEMWYENAEESRINAGIELSTITKEELQKAGIKSNGEKCLICSEKKTIFITLIVVINFVLNVGKNIYKN